MAVSPRVVLGLLWLCVGCHRAQIELDALARGGAVSRSQEGGAGGAGGDGAPDVEAGAGEASQRPSDELRLRLCQDELEPIQALCRDLGPIDCREAYVPSWLGCASECGVCAAELEGYPYYFEWHPCCRVAECKSGATTFCHERCPPPKTQDTVAPCQPKR